MRAWALRGGDTQACEFNFRALLGFASRRGLDFAASHLGGTMLKWVSIAVALGFMGLSMGLSAPAYAQKPSCEALCQKRCVSANSKGYCQSECVKRCYFSRP